MIAMSKTQSEKRRNVVADSLRIQTVPHPFRFRENPDNSLNRLIVEAVNRMGEFGDDAEANYQTVLEALRQRSDEVVAIIAAEYRDLSEAQYLDRWSLVQLLVELRHPSSLSLLNEVLSNQIPEERSQDTDSFTTVGEEVMIKTTAVEALTQMSAQQNQDALDLLLRYTQHENFSIKRACVQGYLAYGGEGATERLLEFLPEQDRFILDIRREDVRNVPQPRGENYLRREESGDTPRLQTRRD